MLEAYEQAPDAFTSTAAEREAEPQSWWIKRIGGADGLATSFGAWKGSSLVRTVALEYSAIEAASARPEILSLTLTVTEGNAPALRLYRSVGFVA